MPDAEPGERRGDLAPLGRRGGREPRPQPRAAGIDPELPPRLGIDEPELAHVRQLLLARVADLDRDDVVPAGEREERPAPVERAAKVGDEHDERALAAERADAVDRLAERARRRALAVRPPSCVPSEISRTAEGGIVPSFARSRRASLTESATASPSAVPSPGRSASSPSSTSERSSVGATTTTAREANDTSATWNFSGTLARNALAAARAAPSRDGRTSVAAIDRETSIASTTVASSRLTVTVACGRATPTIIAASATRKIASGTCRRRPGRRSTTLGRSAGLPKRAPACARRRSPRTYRPASSGTTARAASASGHWKLSAASGAGRR